MKVWDIKKTQYRVSDFLSWQRAETLKLSPSFQRRPVWKPDAKSYFVDTVIRGLPVPVIILREKRSDISRLEPVREVVDGQQRLRTLFAYIDANLLDDYKPQTDSFLLLPEHNEDYAGRPFKALPQNIQQYILDYEFSVHILPSGTDDREVLGIFARLNSTGVKLTPQELRNAQFFGAFKVTMYELATEQLYRWREWRVFNEYNLARMEEVELVSELCLMMIRHQVIGKTQKAIDKIYADKDKQFLERDEISRRFRIVMDTIDDLFGPQLRSLPFRRKALFFNLFAFLYDYRFTLTSDLTAKVKAKSIEKRILTRALTKAGEMIARKEAPEEVLEAAARRTTHPSSRKTIFEYLWKSVQNEHA
ncbi:DUF262 domain-containing protein [Rhodocaloribacter sp.]